MKYEGRKKDEQLVKITKILFFCCYSKIKLSKKKTTKNGQNMNFHETRIRNTRNEDFCIKIEE